MLYRNINKKSLLVIFWITVLLSAAACGPVGMTHGTPPAFSGEHSNYGKPEKVGRVASKEIDEGSGIAASRCQPNVLWTHNDSGDGPYIYAMDTAGRDLGTWKVQNADNVDWEDIAEYKSADGKCFLYLADTGNSNKDPRTEHRIYRLAEPQVPEGGADSSRKDPGQTSPADVITFAYPDGTHDAETLMVEPATEVIYVVTKNKTGPAGVYKLKPAFGGPTVRPDKIADVTVPAVPNGFLTSGDIAPDGKRLVICDYFAAYEFSLPPGAASFDDIWKQKPDVIDLGDRKQGEAIGYSADGRSLFATSEGKNEPLIRLERRN